MTPFRFEPAVGTPVSFARPPSDTVYANVLTANTRETVTVPTGAKVVVFSSTADFYAKPDDSGSPVTVPAGDIVATAGELNPAIWSIEGVTSIGLIAAGTPTITMSFYSRG